MNEIDLWRKEEKMSFSGWDFSHLNNRKTNPKIPWDYKNLAKKLVRRSDSILDMGTGGGEIFSSFAPFRNRAIATEGYQPNYILAKKRLKLLGVRVVKFSNSTTRKMPFKNEEFDLVLNRHDAFNIKELSRILQPGGTFLTQQVGKDNWTDLQKAFKANPQFDVATFQSVKRELRNAGFRIKISEEWKGVTEFRDVGAIVYLLANVPWVVKDFSVDKHLKYLIRLQNRVDKGNKLIFREHRYLIQAEKM